MIHLLDDSDELDDFVGPAEHGKAERGLFGDSLVPSDHLLLHPPVSLIHLRYHVDVFLLHCADIKLLEALQELFLFELPFDLGPELTHQYLVTGPVHIGGHLWERVPQNKHCKDRLDDKVGRFWHVAQLESSRSRLGRVFDEASEQLVDLHLVCSQFFVALLVFLGKSDRYGDQISVYMLLNILHSNIPPDKARFIQLF